MLQPEQFDHMAMLHRDGVPTETIKEEARKIQHSMNPHPAGQLELNRPMVDGKDCFWYAQVP